ncbi:MULTISPECIES: TonB-dependent receptor plug domain-containing protein [Flavobacteriaceae]|uniref:TonB-dependent receptor plug domain-containing protein n=1 Tax=Flavobacteriaceae TaxID=49546 RepID=UPI003A8EA3A8
MSLNKNNILIYFSLFLSACVFSQEVLIDSTRTEELNEVVITGQYNRQSIKKSVHNVIVIDREQIDNQAANNLADLLNFNLNLNIIPDAQTGKSQISFFGLDAKYFNILIDNIPLVGDNGLGNNIDLTQVNLDEIERIEIVEGSMGVEYGANAVSGIINIITKKAIDTNWQIQASIQEETVGGEYAWFDEGRHIQSVNVAHNINEKWFAKAGLNRNDFAGYFGDKQGKDYYQNDGLRGYEWLPKVQLNTNAIINYKSELFQLDYRFDYFNEVLNYYDESVRPNIDIGSQTSNPSATDKIYTTNRFVNNLNIYGRFKTGANYKASFSYQQQERDINKFNYYILTEEKSNETDETYQSTKVFFSNGSINNLVKNDRFNFQFGYETRFIKGFDTQASGDYTQFDKTQSQTNLATYASTEYKFTDKLIVRPGLRYEYNSQFYSKFLGSLSARYLFVHGIELRANIGSSYRTPSFEELYYYFVDSNHDVRGNENLNPENGYTVFLNLKKNSWFDNFTMLNQLKLSYLSLEDKIDLAIVNTLPLQYQYINIDSYKLWGLTSENTIKTDRWSLNLGATLQGISRGMNDEVNVDDEFLYAFQINTSSTYHIKKWDTYITLLYKYNGEQENYVATGTDSEGNSTFSIETIDDYSWLDASVKKSFLADKFLLTIGGRNLLNITSVDIRNSTSNGGTHSGGNNNLLLGYGRSFYIKLLYNLNF